MKNKYTLSIIILILTFLAGFTQNPFPYELQESFQQSLENTYPKEGAKGATMAVYMPDCNLIWSGSAGYSHINPDSLVASDARFRVASVSKTFCSVIIMQLRDQGKLNLDDVISDHLSQNIVSMIPNSNKITIRKLLNHSSGLKSHTNNQQYLNLLNQNLKRNFTPEECIQYAVDLGPASGPEYTNTGFLLLALIAESAAEKPYHELIQSNIIDAVGLQNTFVPRDYPNDYLIPGHHFHEYNTSGRIPDYSLSSLFGSGEMISTAEDLVKYYDAVYNAQIISSNSRDLMFTVSNGYANYGLGAFAYPSNGGIYGHGGNLFGISTGVYYLKQVDAFIAFGENVYGKNGNDYLVGVLEALQNLTDCPISTLVENNNQYSPDINFDIFPNPNNGNFTIAVPPALDAEEFSVSISNGLGQIVYQLSTASTNLIHINDLNPGIYLININYNKNKITKKIIVN